MNQNRLINKLLAITLIISLTLGCNFLTGLGRTPNPNLPPAALPEIVASNNPQTLADHITQAATADERYIALLEIMKSLNLGVYTGKGEAIVPGAERGPSDFYLYDFEVSAIAGALGRKETWSVSDLATQLSDIGVQPSGKPLPLQDLQESLTSSAIESIQDSGNPLSLMHLLIRELGLRQTPSYDISAATSSSSEQIKFDALQRFLILSDILIPLGATSAQSHIFEKPVNLISNDSIRLSVSGNPCSFIGPEDVNGFKFGKLFITIMGIPGIGDYIQLTGIVLDAWHGELLGLLMDAQETKASIGQHTAHYGPKGAHVGLDGDPGEQIFFQIGVQMLADLSKYPQLLCGKLAGLTFPPKGPVKGVNITWDHAIFGGIADYELLKKHGTIVRQDATTDSNGLASLVFQPKDEPNATISIRQSKENIKSVEGVLFPTVSVASSFGNIMAVGADLFIPKTVGFGFIIEFHETKGWKLEGWNEMSLNGFIMTGGLSCDSPYGPWEFGSEGTTSQGGTGSSTFKVPFSEDGNATATHNEHTTLPSVNNVGDWNGIPKVTITPVIGGYRMDFGPDHMTGSSCTLGQCQNVDTVKKAWSINIVPAEPGECPQP